MHDTPKAERIGNNEKQPKITAMPTSGVATAASIIMVSAKRMTTANILVKTLGAETLGSPCLNEPKVKNQCWANDLVAHKCEAKRPGGNDLVGSMASAATRPCGLHLLAGLCLAPTRHTHGVEGGREKKERERTGEREP